VSIYFYMRYRASTARLKRCVKRLRELQLDDPKAAEVLQEAFVLFDADNSGYLDGREGRKLLKVVNPKLSRAQIAEAIRAADNTGQGIVEDDFHEMVTRWALMDEKRDVEEKDTTSKEVKVLSSTASAPGTSIV
jgi:hypothetical protein